jgi:hypothetical protein
MKVSCKVDIRPVSRVTRAAEKRLNSEAVGDDMKKIFDAAAREERDTHVYNNYTFRLEGSTFALGPFFRGDEVEVEYGARMEYASFVENRGRTRVRELGLKAATELDFFFDGEADELGRM